MFKTNNLLVTAILSKNPTQHWLITTISSVPLGTANNYSILRATWHCHNSNIPKTTHLTLLVTIAFSEPFTWHYKQSQYSHNYSFGTANNCNILKTTQLALLVTSTSSEPLLDKLISPFFVNLTLTLFFNAQNAQV